MWNIVTGVYPPQSGGVADYTRVVANGLAERGEDVRVWTGPGDHSEYVDGRVTVYRLPDHFGPAGLACLNARIGRGSRDRLLIQYVPHAFGWKAMNIPFCAWAAAQKNVELAVTFHEVAFPVVRGQPLRHNALGIVNQVMARMVARAARKLFVTASAWESLLCKALRGSRSTVWTPVPSNVERIDNAEASVAVRMRYASKNDFIVGHFAWMETQWSAGVMSAVVRNLLSRRKDVTFMLIGCGSDDLGRAVAEGDPSLTGRVISTGQLTPTDLSCHLSACDLLIQPYPDGISGRRTTAMAALSHNLPVLSTEGCHTENIWRESGAVSLASDANARDLADRANALLDCAVERLRLGAAGMQLYKRRFDLRHTLDALCQ